MTGIDFVPVSRFRLFVALLRKDLGAYAPMPLIVIAMAGIAVGGSNWIGPIVVVTSVAAAMWWTRDPLGDPRAFWATLPIPARDLIAARLLGIGLLVLLPLVIAETVALARVGFGFADVVVGVLQGLLFLLLTVIVIGAIARLTASWWRALLWGLAAVLLTVWIVRIVGDVIVAELHVLAMKGTVVPDAALRLVALLAAVAALLLPTRGRRPIRTVALILVAALFGYAGPMMNFAAGASSRPLAPTWDAALTVDATGLSILLAADRVIGEDSVAKNPVLTITDDDGRTRRWSGERLGGPTWAHRDGRDFVQWRIEDDDVASIVVAELRFFTPDLWSSGSTRARAVWGAPFDEGGRVLVAERFPSGDVQIEFERPHWPARGIGSPLGASRAVALEDRSSGAIHRLESDSRASFVRRAGVTGASGAGTRRSRVFDARIVDASGRTVDAELADFDLVVSEPRLVGASRRASVRWNSLDADDEARWARATIDTRD